MIEEDDGMSSGASDREKGTMGTDLEFEDEWGHLGRVCLCQAASALSGGERGRPDWEEGSGGGQGVC